MTFRRIAYVLFCLTACSSTHNASIDAPAGGDGARVDAAVDAAGSDVCTTIAATRCTKLQSCSATDLEKRFGDLATCETRERLACAEGLAAPNTGQNATAIQACNDALAAETCVDFFTKAPPAACVAQHGPGSDGAACGFFAQCSTGFCGVESTALCGTCAPQPKAGDSCATGCGQDLVCDATSQLCEAPVAAQGACSRLFPCADGFTCVGATGGGSGSGSGSGSGTPGTCVAEVATAGSACDPRHKTGPDCSGDGGLTCDQTTLQCIAQPLVGAGSACGLISGVRTACTGAATCVITPPSTAGICVAPAADGAACDTATGPGCFTPAKCVTSGSGTAGTCELPGSSTCS